MSENNIKGIMDTTLDKLRGMVDADVIIGTPIKVDKVTLIPVSKASFGLASGGSDFGNKSDKPLFGGGGGAGVSLTPIAFIAVNGDNVRMMPVYNDMGTIDKAINMAPDIFERVKNLFTKKDNVFDPDEYVEKLDETKPE